MCPNQWQRRGERAESGIVSVSAAATHGVTLQPCDSRGRSCPAWPSFNYRRDRLGHTRLLVPQDREAGPRPLVLHVATRL